MPPLPSALKPPITILLPLIATALFAAYHSGYAISVYIAVLCVISFIATVMMPDYTGKDISDDAYSED